MTLAVLGAGVMGTGIATLAIGHGMPVILVDVDEQILDKARGQVRQQVRLATLMRSFPSGVATGELTVTTNIEDIAPSTAVIESITEHPELKARSLADVSTMVKPGTLLVSNTSAIPIDEMADSVVRPEDFLGIHFMNPPYLIRTVELIRGPRTGEPAVQKAQSMLSTLHMKAVVVGDGPGFVINRVLQRMINESARIVQEGIATPEAVDAVFTGCLGHRTGPLGTADLIGLDNVADSLNVLLDRTGDEGYRPCDLLLAKVKAGEHGRKTGTGFFEHGGTR